MSQGLYVIDTASAKNSSLICNTSTSSLVWHYQLGHISNVGLHAICKYYLLYQIKILRILVMLAIMPSKRNYIFL